VTGNGGGKAAQLQITQYSNGAANWVFDHVTDSSHTVYQFNEDYKATAPTELDIEFLMSNGTYDYEWLDTLPAATSWQTISTQVTVPTGAVSFTVLHILARVGTLTIDNASLTPVNTPFAQGMVTFSFDDGLLSQSQNAAPMLKVAGFPASFYIITGEPTSGDSGYMTWPQIKALSTQGFEIGGHTRTHPMLTTLTPAQQQSEIAGSFTDLVAQGFSPKTFVYPYGDENTSVEQLVKNAGYVGARGSYYGLETPVVDHENLYDIRLDSTSNLATIKQYIDQAKADKRWIVFEIHDVLASNGDTYTITPAFFQSVVNYVKTSGVQVVTMQQGISQLNP
jgi:peptidoglycan/xylan/chitin deacetylase (PgdA/CDA1 family)